MSVSNPEQKIDEHAKLFSVLGDRTRLKLVNRLIDGEKRSISELASGFDLSRQALTKHLRLLEGVGVVRSEKSGREHRYQFELQSLREGREMLESIEGQWAQTLIRLKQFVED